MWNAATYLAPVLGPEDTYNPFYGSGQTINNPRYTIDLNDNTLERFASTNTLYVDIKPIEGLKISSKFTYYLYQRHDYRFYPSTLPVKNEGEGGEGYRAEYDTRTLSTENTVTYAYTAKTGHYFDVMGGFTGSKSRLNGFDLNAKGLIVDDNKWNNMNGIYDKENYTSTSYTNYITKMSVLARVNYNYKKRYYLTLTGRYDGSSNFAANHKWGFFPSAAVKWNISNEYFMRRVRWIEELSLRVSAGRTATTPSNPTGARSRPTPRPRTATCWGGLAVDGVLPGACGERQPHVGDHRPLQRRHRRLAVQETPEHHLRSLHFENPRPAVIGPEGLAVGLHEPFREHRTHVEQRRGADRRDAQHRQAQVFVVHVAHALAQQTDSRGYRLGGFRQRDEQSRQQPVHDVRLRQGPPLNALWGFKYGGVWHNQERSSATR